MNCLISLKFADCASSPATASLLEGEGIRGPIAHTFRFISPHHSFVAVIVTGSYASGDVTIKPLQSSNVSKRPRNKGPMRPLIMNYVGKSATVVSFEE